jgi:hypothetical protein
MRATSNLKPRGAPTDAACDRCRSLVRADARNAMTESSCASDTKRQADQRRILELMPYADPMADRDAMSDSRGGSEAPTASSMCRLAARSDGASRIRMSRSVVVQSVPQASRAGRVYAVTRVHDSDLEAAGAARERPIVPYPIIPVGNASAGYPIPPALPRTERRRPPFGAPASASRRWWTSGSTFRALTPPTAPNAESERLQETAQGPWEGSPACRRTGGIRHPQPTRRPR